VRRGTRVASPFKSLQNGWIVLFCQPPLGVHPIRAWCGPFHRVRQLGWLDEALRQLRALVSVSCQLGWLIDETRHRATRFIVSADSDGERAENARPVARARPSLPRSHSARHRGADSARLVSQ